MEQRRPAHSWRARSRFNRSRREQRTLGLSVRESSPSPGDNSRAPDEPELVGRPHGLINFGAAHPLDEIAKEASGAVPLPARDVDEI